MPDELFSHNHTIDIRAIADVQQHVRDAGSRGLFKRRENAPYAVDFLFHLLLLLPHQIPRALIVYYRRVVIWAIARRGESHIPKFVYHVTLRMPMLILSISEDLDKLLKNCRLTSVALLSKLGRVMIMTVDLSIVFIVAVLSTKDR